MVTHDAHLAGGLHFNRSWQLRRTDEGTVIEEQLGEPVGRLSRAACVGQLFPGRLSRVACYGPLVTGRLLRAEHHGRLTLG